MKRKFIHNDGFSLIELTIIIITIGILAAIAMQSMTVVITDNYRLATEREMEMLAYAIAGDPSIMANGIRSDFGYIGDVGAFPPNLSALTNNPGFATWDGPYIPSEYTQDNNGYQLDAWGNSYTYNGGTTITSTGNGTITKKIADATSDYLVNSFTGYIYDAAGNAPGTTYMDSLQVLITIPNGTGGTITKSYIPESSGQFILDSLPVGSHRLQIIYSPDVDTLITNVTVLPRNKLSRTFRFVSAYFAGSSGGGSGGGGVTTGLVAHWEFDESSGTSASDNTGNGHTGTLTDMDPVNDWVAGHIGGALDFDGNNDNVESPDADDLDNTNALTITAWAYPTNLNGNPQAIISKRIYFPNDNSYGIFFYTANRLNVDIDSNNDRFSSNTIFSDNQWYHIAVVFDGTQTAGQRVRIYVNGALDITGAESSSVLPNYSSPIKIGQLNGNNGSFFEGRLDDIRIYNRVLSNTEIQTLAGM